MPLQVLFSQSRSPLPWLSLILATTFAGLAVVSKADSPGRSVVSPFASLTENGLDDWQHNGNWKIEQGVITRLGKGGNLTYTKSDLPDDFELRFEWKVGEGSNSGVYYRPGQYEYQILDNKKHRDGQNPRTSAASLYFCMQPSEDATRQVGEWNEGRIVCQGTWIQHWLNGTKVIDFNYADPQWKFHVDLLKQRGGTLSDRGGKLWLQDHGDPVSFRNLQLRTIGPHEVIEHGEVVPQTIPEDVLKKEAEKLAGIVQRRQQAAARKKAKAER